jgi:hypothetical protein
VVVDVRLFELLLHLLCAALGGMEDFVEVRFWWATAGFLSCAVAIKAPDIPRFPCRKGVRIRLRLHLLC